jgi:hypothetical protein
MAGHRSEEYRRLAAECLAMAQQSSDTNLRPSLAEMAQRWLDLAELTEHGAEKISLRRRALQTAIGDGLRELYRLTPSLPPHVLALLAQLNAENTRDGAEM